MSVFLFAYGGLQLIEWGFSASIGLWRYVDSFENRDENSLGR